MKIKLASCMIYKLVTTHNLIHLVHHNHENNVFLFLVQTHKVTQIIPSQAAQLSGPVQIQNLATQPAKIPLARIMLPPVSGLQLNTVIEGGRKAHEISLGSPRIRSNIWGLQKKNVITRPHSLLKSNTRDAPRAVTKMQEGTQDVNLGLSETEKNYNRRQMKKDQTRLFSPKVYKIRLKLKEHLQFPVRTKRLKLQKN